MSQHNKPLEKVAEIPPQGLSSGSMFAGAKHLRKAATVTIAGLVIGYPIAGVVGIWGVGLVVYFALDYYNDPKRRDARNWPLIQVADRLRQGIIAKVTPSPALGSQDWTSTLAAKTSNQIAVIGTERSGKTVFIATLAKYLDARQSQGWFLDPQNVQTQQYVDRVWSMLTAGDWPPITPTGTFQQLRWKVCSPNGATATLRILDPPGHDIRRLFSDNRADPGSVPEDLQELADYCRNADILIFLVNMKDFLGEPRLEMRSATELALKFAMEYVKQAGPHSKQCCLVFTQRDQYPGLAQEEGSWANVARKYLPRLFGGHLSQGDIPVLAVSAVNLTQLVVDAQGRAMKVPAQGFQSDGYDDLLAWIEDAQRRLGQRAMQDDLFKIARRAAVALGALIVVWLLWSAIVAPISEWLFSRATPPPPPKIPAPVISEEGAKYIGGIPLFQDLQVYGYVTNQGAPGYVTVVAQMTQDGSTSQRSQTCYLKTGQKEWFSLIITEYDRGNCTYQVFAKSN